MDRFKLGIGLFFAILAVAAGRSEAQPKDPITIEIIPTTYRADGKGVIELHPPTGRFYVLITNVSDEPVRLWREWCSWGYLSLSFRLTEAGRGTVIARRGPKDWKRNIPDWFVVPPGRCTILDISFDEPTEVLSDSNWAGYLWPVDVDHLTRVPLLSEDGREWVVRMTAVLEIHADWASQKYNVWTGSASSEEIEFIIKK